MGKDRRKKGCFNCNDVKIKYDSDVILCPKCGSKLEFVCASRNCYTKLIDSDNNKYCFRCEADREDKWENFKDKAGKIGVAVASVGVAVLSVVSTVVGIKNNKKK